MLHIVKGGPPASSTDFSLPAVKNPMDRLSGDQKGEKAPSVSGTTFGDNESIACTHSRTVPDSSRAVKAKFRPSGDDSSPTSFDKVVIPEVRTTFFGSEKLKRTTFPGAGSRRYNQAADKMLAAAITKNRNAAILQ